MSAGAIEPMTGLRLPKFPDAHGIIQPLRDRIAQLEREYETMTIIAQGEIQRLQTENETLRMALEATKAVTK